MGSTYEQLDAQLVAATESDDRELASEILKKIEDLPVDVQDGAMEAPATMTDSITLTKAALGIGEAFDPQLTQLTPEQIAQLVVEVSDADDLMAMILPGTSVIDADNRTHLTQRGDVKRAARGLALAAAGGVDFESKLITSNSGSKHTIENDECVEITVTSQPNFQGGQAVLRSKKPCQGHLEYRKVGTSFEKTGGEHMRCLHQWALVFATGGYVTASAKIFGAVAITEIGQRVGDETARANADAVIGTWVEKADARREEREIYAKAINHEKNEGRTTAEGRLNPRPEISQFLLPSGETVAQAVSALKGQYFTLTIELPLNNKMAKRTTRVVRNLSELADAVATNFAVASQYGGEVKALSVNAH